MKIKIIKGHEDQFIAEVNEFVDNNKVVNSSFTMFNGIHIAYILHEDKYGTEPTELRVQTPADSRDKRAGKPKTPRKKPV